MHTSLKGLVGMSAWLITGLASLNIGANALFQFDVIDRYLLSVKMPVEVVIGVAGLITLLTFLSSATGHCCSCE